MFVWVLYDIPNDKKRREVIKECKNLGLYRVQRSIFFWNLEDGSIRLLTLILEYLTDIEEDSIYIFPMGKKELNEAEFMGVSFNRDLVIDEYNTIIF